MPKIVIIEGVERETLAIGKNLMIVRFAFRQGAEVPWHAHEHEQSSYIVQGRLKLLLKLLLRDEMMQDHTLFSEVMGDSTMNDDAPVMEIILTQGMSAIVPPHVQHKAIALEDTIDVNAFTPIREDYL